MGPRPELPKLSRHMNTEKPKWYRGEDQSPFCFDSEDGCGIYHVWTNRYHHHFRPRGYWTICDPEGKPLYFVEGGESPPTTGWISQAERDREARERDRRWGKNMEAERNAPPFDFSVPMFDPEDPDL